MGDKMDFDMAWIIPLKLLAFKSPSAFAIDSVLRPVDYLGFFNDNNIRSVIRLNQSTYDASIFE